MKTTSILIVLLFLNTTALMAEPLAQFIQGINTWILIAVETLLFAVYYIINIIKSVRKAFEIDLSDLKLYA